MKRQLELDADDDYVDDPIRLFDYEPERVLFGNSARKFAVTNDVINKLRPIMTCTEVKEFTEEQLSEVSESDCIALKVKLVDCIRFPWYFRKYTQQILNNIDDCILVSDNDSDCTIIVEEKQYNDEEWCSMYDKRFKKVKSKCSVKSSLATLKEITKQTIQKEPEKVGTFKVQETTNPRKLSKVDFKRNKGLVGMSISQRYVISGIPPSEIDEINKRDEVKRSKRHLAHEFNANISNTEFTDDRTRYMSGDTNISYRIKVKNYALLNNHINNEVQKVEERQKKPSLFNQSRFIENDLQCNKSKHVKGKYNTSQYIHNDANKVSDVKISHKNQVLNMSSHKNESLILLTQFKEFKETSKNKSKKPKILKNIELATEYKTTKDNVARVNYNMGFEGNLYKSHEDKIQLKTPLLTSHILASDIKPTPIESEVDKAILHNFLKGKAAGNIGIVDKLISAINVDYSKMNYKNTITENIVKKNVPHKEKKRFLDKPEKSSIINEELAENSRQYNENIFKSCITNKNLQSEYRRNENECAAQDNYVLSLDISNELSEQIVALRSTPSSTTTCNKGPPVNEYVGSADALQYNSFSQINRNKPIAIVLRPSKKSYGVPLAGQEKSHNPINTTVGVQPQPNQTPFIFSQFCLPPESRKFLRDNTQKVQSEYSKINCQKLPSIAINYELPTIKDTFSLNLQSSKHEQKNCNHDSSSRSVLVNDEWQQPNIIPEKVSKSLHLHKIYPYRYKSESSTGNIPELKHHREKEINNIDNKNASVTTCDTSKTGLNKNTNIGNKVLLKNTDESSDEVIKRNQILPSIIKPCNTSKNEMLNLLKSAVNNLKGVQFKNKTAVADTERSDSAQTVANMPKKLRLSNNLNVAQNFNDQLNEKQNGYSSPILPMPTFQNVLNKSISDSHSLGEVITAENSQNHSSMQGRKIEEVINKITVQQHNRRQSRKHNGGKENNEKNSKSVLI